MSKLAVFVKLKTSNVYFIRKRSLSFVSFTMEMSARFCHGCRKMLRWPLLIKLVSYGSFEGIPPPKSPGFSRGRVKHEALSAGVPPGSAPLAPVTALFGVQFEASGTIGFVIPSDVPK